MISEKIIVIDDDERIVKSIKMTFPEYEIIGFNNGADALEYLKRPNQINLILLDIIMPQVNGLTLLTEIKNLKRDIAVIMVTAYGSRDIVMEALRNQADDFIDKPFTPDDLKEKISSILRKKMYSQNFRKDKDEQMSRIKRFIERNYQNVTLKFIAEEMCLSSRYVSRMFNEKNQLNYRQFKLKIKMDRAKVLLANTQLNINEIAIQLGYQNPETFMRIFKRITKMTPSEYRLSNSKMAKL
jgi:two-component system response regulator YesN